MYLFPALSAMAFLCLFPSALEDGDSTDVCHGSPTRLFRQGLALAVPAVHSRSQLHRHQHFAFKKSLFWGCFMNPHLLQCLVPHLTSLALPKPPRCWAELEAPQSLSLWPAGKRSLTDQNSQTQSLFHKNNHSKFKVKQGRH